jgi:hypothetical protein
VTAVLPKPLRGLTPDQLEEVVDLAELKAWVRATEVQGFTDRELEVIDKAELQGPRAAKLVRERLYRKYLWDSLRWYLFGGYVDLVGFQERPLKAYDPDTNPWIKLWVPGWARTKDEHDTSSPYKPLPDKDYLRLIAYTWVHEPLLAVPKSRQMMATWLFCCIASWMVSFQHAQLIGFVSKKEGDADKLLERVQTVRRGLPRERFYVPGDPTRDKKYAEIHVKETDSTIMALSENPDGVRSHTFSWLFSDEVAFQEYAAEQIRATLPAVKGGARFTLVTTSNGEETFHQVISEGGRIPCPPGR